MQATGLDHIILTISDAERARAFYGDLLGFDVKMMPHGGCRFRLRDMEFFLIASPQLIEGDRFSEGRIGLDHISFRAPSMDALHELAAKLQAAGIETKGVEQFKPSGNWYVAFRDPDNIQLEYWLP